MDERFWEIDFFRGIAIILMVLFHLFWNLNYFDLTQFALYSGWFGVMQKLAASTFLFLVGVCLTLSFHKHKNFKKHFIRRGLKVFGAGLIITAFTLLAVPDKFIFFGVLHLIGLSIILSIPFVSRKKLSFFAAGATILLSLLLANLSLKLPFPFLSLFSFGTIFPLQQLITFQ